MSITLSALQRQRRDTAANWTAENPTLLAGEIGLESDTGYWKVGDGATAWTSLAYVSGLGAEIPVDRLADGAARQLLQTDAAGTGVEWTDNVDVPGTLDVTGAGTFDGNVTIAGDLTVNGTTTTINTQDLLVEDKNVVIGNVTTPSDVTADGGGITLKGATDKTINWIDATDAWTSSERFSVPLGSAAAPSLTFTGDENTGIYSPGADQLALSTNGTGRLFVDGNGRVGVGTASPQAKLDVQGIAKISTPDAANVSVELGSGATGDRSTFIDFVGDTTYTDYGLRVIRNPGANGGSTLATRGTGALTFQGIESSPFVFVHGPSTERARIDSSGRLLVGTSTNSGGALLQVNGDRVRIATAKTPASATDTGTTGEVCWDANYVYVCTATNTWKRTALATW